MADHDMRHSPIRGTGNNNCFRKAEFSDQLGLQTHTFANAILDAKLNNTLIAGSCENAMNIHSTKAKFLGNSLLCQPFNIAMPSRSGLPTAFFPINGYEFPS